MHVNSAAAESMQGVVFACLEQLPMLGACRPCLKQAAANTAQECSSPISNKKELALSNCPCWVPARKQAGAANKTQHYHCTFKRGCQKLQTPRLLAGAAHVACLHGKLGSSSQDT
jgi:hypothetical protein